MEIADSSQSLTGVVDAPYLVGFFVGMFLDRIQILLVGGVVLVRRHCFGNARRKFLTSLDDDRRL